MVSTKSVSKGPANDPVGDYRKTTKKVEKEETAPTETRKGAKKAGKPAVKVEISPEGRAAAEKAGDTEDSQEEREDKADAATVGEKMEKTVDDKKKELVNFYAKQLVKAADKLDLDAVKKEAEEVLDKGEKEIK